MKTFCKQFHKGPKGGEFQRGIKRQNVIVDGPSRIRDWGDYGARLQHLKRSLSILEDAFAAEDWDLHIIQRLGKVIDAMMDWAIRNNDEGVAKTAVEVLRRYNSLIGPNGIDLFHLRRFKTVFGESPDLIGQMDGLAIKESELDFASAGEDDQRTQQTTASVSESPVRIVGTVYKLALGTNFGFICDDAGINWFFHRGELESAQDWREMKPGKKVSFLIGRNARGSCAIGVALLK
jgi:cold shock CspA family protein